MEKFVKTVNRMDETILIPCRLMDLKAAPAADEKPNGKSKKGSADMLTSTDLYDLYNMLNNVKVDLLWGGKAPAEESSAEETTTQLPAANNNSAPATSPDNNTLKVTNNKPGLARRPSTASMASTNSAVSLSDCDSDAGNENDSGIESEEGAEKKDKSRLVSENFRRHLFGLYRTLEQMTEAANYVTDRYQTDVGSV